MYKIMNEKQICYTAIKRQPITQLQAPYFGQTLTECGGIKLV